MKIVLIVGARPQFIKLAPLYNLLVNKHEVFIIHTGQHFNREMSDVFFKDFQLPQPDFNLNIIKNLHGEQTGYMLIEIEKLLINTKPDFVIVFGDTNSTLAGALAASKLQVKSIHIEAGLRSYNKTMPEEINRIVSDHVCDFLFAPTKTAMDNLKKENLELKSFLTGDIMVDSLNYALNNINVLDGSVEFKFNGDFYLLTLHRPYNVDIPNRLKKILEELGRTSFPIVFPIHPRTKKNIELNDILIPDNIIVIEPLSYIKFIHLMSKSAKVITDSGGIQKEAYILKKPCITLRSETEWIETVSLGWNILLNPENSSDFADKIDNFIPKGNYEALFGENVASKMVKILEKLGDLK